MRKESFSTKPRKTNLSILFLFGIALACLCVFAPSSAAYEIEKVRSDIKKQESLLQKNESECKKLKQEQKNLIEKSNVPDEVVRKNAEEGLYMKSEEAIADCEIRSKELQIKLDYHKAIEASCLEPDQHKRKCLQAKAKAIYDAEKGFAESMEGWYTEIKLGNFQCNVNRYLAKKGKTEGVVFSTKCNAALTHEPKNEKYEAQRKLTLRTQEIHKKFEDCSESSTPEVNVSTSSDSDDGYRVGIAYDGTGHIGLDPSLEIVVTSGQIYSRTRRTTINRGFKIYLNELIEIKSESARVFYKGKDGNSGIMLLSKGSQIVVKKETSKKKPLIEFVYGTFWNLFFHESPRTTRFTSTIVNLEPQGTEFFVSVNKRANRCAVIKGQVRATLLEDANKKRIIKPGQELVATQEGSMNLRRISRQDLLYHEKVFAELEVQMAELDPKYEQPQKSDSWEPIGAGRSNPNRDNRNVPSNEGGWESIGSGKSKQW